MRSRVLGLAAITLTSLGVSRGLVGDRRRRSTAAAPLDCRSHEPKVPRTPWGDPDLQGTWDYRTITPLERPREFGTREFYTEEEKKTLEGRAGRRMDGPPEEIRPGLTHAQYVDRSRALRLPTATARRSSWTRPTAAFRR